MSYLKLPISKVNEVRKLFFKTLKGLPTRCTLITLSLDSDTADGFSSLMKSIERTTPATETKVSVLYRKEFSEYERQKMGLHIDVKAVIWISPDELPVTIGQRFEDTLRKVRFDDFHDNEVYVIQSVIYKEPLQYGSRKTCIAIEIHLKDDKSA